MIHKKRSNKVNVGILKENKSLVANVSVFLFVTALFWTPKVHANQTNHIGADIAYALMRHEKDYGGNVLPKRAPGINLFVGHMFNDVLGIEAGYEIEKKVHRKTIPGGSTVYGIQTNQAVLTHSNHQTTLKQNSPYIGLITKTNITNKDKVSLLIGASIFNIKIKSISDDAFVGQANLIREEMNFSKTKPIMIIKAMLEHKFTDQFGMRISTTWKNTSKINIIAKEAATIGTNDQIKLKNFITFGEGLIHFIH